LINRRRLTKTRRRPTPRANNRSNCQLRAKWPRPVRWSGPLFKFVALWATKQSGLSKFTAMGRASEQAKLHQQSEQRLTNLANCARQSLSGPSSPLFPALLQAETRQQWELVTAPRH
jgi:hypothetical protein